MAPNEVVSGDYIISSIRLYGCLQSIMKMHPLFDLALINIIRLDPYAIVVISRNSRQFEWHDKFLRRVTSVADREGVDISGRLIFINQMKHKYYSYLLCNLDVSLDPFPFGYP